MAGHHLVIHAQGATLHEQVMPTRSNTRCAALRALEARLPLERVLTPLLKRLLSRKRMQNRNNAVQFVMQASLARIFLSLIEKLAMSGLFCKPVCVSTIEALQRFLTGALPPTTSFHVPVPKRRLCTRLTPWNSPSLARSMRSAKNARPQVSITRSYREDLRPQFQPRYLKRFARSIFD